MYLVLVVRTGYAHRVPHICCICAEQIIIIFIILPCNLPGSLATKVCVSGLTYAMSPQHFLRRRIYRIAFSAPNLLSAGGRRSYIKFICYSVWLLHHRLTEYMQVLLWVPCLFLAKIILLSFLNSFLFSIYFFLLSSL